MIFILLFFYAMIVAGCTFIMIFEDIKKLNNLNLFEKIVTCILLFIINFISLPFIMGIVIASQLIKK